MGADLARWGKMAEMLVRMVTSKSWVDSNDALIQALGKNSETLQNITDSFLGLSTQFRMFFFWEELKTYIPGMTRDVVGHRHFRYTITWCQPVLIVDRLLNMLPPFRKRFLMLGELESMPHIRTCASLSMRMLRGGTS
jgi:hypothetical protein